MKEFLEFLIKSIVKNPDDVKVDTKNLNGVDTLIIHVEEEDMGIVIGKEGRTIKSIRNLVKSKAIKDNLRINVELFDPKYDQV